MKKIIKTDAEWKKILTPEQYNILRKKGTEIPNSCGLLNNKEEGIYSCVACKNKLFKSSKKFDSGTGWPSFFEPYSNEALEYRDDISCLINELIFLGFCLAKSSIFVAL